MPFTSRTARVQAHNARAYWQAQAGERARSQQRNIPKEWVFRLPACHRRTSTPCLARSYIFTPPFLIALYMGGTCMMSPRKDRAASASWASVMWAHSLRSVTWGLMGER